MIEPKNLTEEKKKRRLTDAQLKMMRDKDREIVKGKFIFHEVPGGTLTFVFKKWKGDQVEKYSLKDGEIYSLPLAVALHLNKDCWYPEHAYAEDENGEFKQRITRKIRRCSFQSLEFVDTADLTPTGDVDIAIVENVQPGL